MQAHAPKSAELSLDERYLAFEATTRPLFARYPECEPLRQYIFKELLIQRKPFGWQDTAKRWLRPFVRYHHTTQGIVQPCDILLLVEGTREVILDSLLPVYHELKRRGERVQLLSLNGPAHLPAATPTLRYSCSMLTPRWAKEGWEALCRIEPHLDHRWLARAFFGASAEIDGLLMELGHVLDQARPRVVVAASTQLIGGAALFIAARTRKMTTSLLQHGVLQPFYLPLIADHMCTWGPASSETLVRLGVDPRRLRALGSPRHDSLRPLHKNTARQALLRSLSLPDKPTLTFFSNGNDLSRNGQAPVECADWLTTAAKRYQKRLNLIVRLHPNEDGSLYQNNGYLVVAKDQPPLGVVLEGSDCVASLCSTAMLDALLYRTPVWHFHADGWPELATNWRDGLAQRIGSLSQLCDMIEFLLDGRSPHPCPADALGRVFSNHGHATETVAAFLAAECAMPVSA